MVVSSDAGIIKFANNSFAIYQLLSQTPTVTYQGLINFPNFNWYEFDYFNHILYIGNGTDIINYTLQIVRYPSTGAIAAL